MEAVPALLFDTRSIQRFIFSGNRLKTNIGASYLVDHVFDKQLMEVLESETANLEVDKDSWHQELAIDKLQGKRQCVVAANGGGNALLLFSEDVAHEDLIQIVRRFSTLVLTEIPGLHLGAACGKLRLSDDEFQADLKELFQQLKQVQNRVFPVVSIPYTGLTLTCPISGEVANYYDPTGTIIKSDERGQRFCSQEAAVKAKAAHDANLALEKEISKYSSVCQRFAFPQEIDELGQIEREKNYFAIVHIDGNNMGDKFRACRTQSERSRLSENVRRKTWGCFIHLLEHIESEYGKYLEQHALDLGGRQKKDEQGRPYLPIRPIILGGDDVTFVCPAKMAIPYVKRFMEYLLDEHSVEGIEAEAAKRMDSCGGIAILKTTYPFFRGYELAEQLCEAAKQRKRKEKQANPNAMGTSWLDFAILHGEQSPTLEQIRKQEYSGAGGEGGMHFGPYQVGHQEGGALRDHRHDIENLMEAVRQFHQGKHTPKGEGCMARSKAKELRLVLQHGPAEINRFLTQLAHMKQDLPEVEAWEAYRQTENALWSGGETPYVDAIELMEFLYEEA